MCDKGVGVGVPPSMLADPICEQALRDPPRGGHRHQADHPGDQPLVQGLDLPNFPLYYVTVFYGRIIELRLTLKLPGVRSKYKTKFNLIFLSKL